MLQLSTILQDIHTNCLQRPGKIFLSSGVGITGTFDGYVTSIWVRRTIVKAIRNLLMITTMKRELTKETIVKEIYTPINRTSNNW